MNAAKKQRTKLHVASMLLKVSSTLFRRVHDHHHPTLSGPLKTQNIKTGAHQVALAYSLTQIHLRQSSGTKSPNTHRPIISTSCVNRCFITNHNMTSHPIHLFLTAFVLSVQHTPLKPDACSSTSTMPPHLMCSNLMLLACPGKASHNFQT